MSGRRQDVPVSEAAIVKALAHPLRVRILNVLDQRAASPSDLAEELGLPLSNVSYHVRALKELGMISLVRRRQRRGATESFYRARARPVITDAGWGQVPSAVKSAMVDASLRTSGEYVAAAAAAGGFDRPDAHLSRTTFACDAQAWTEVTAVIAETFARVRAIADQSAERIAQDPEAAHVDASTILMFFEGGEPTTPHAPPQDGG